jgi:hypothetical protein
MGRLINQKNVSLTTNKRKLPMSFAIANNQLAPDTEATDLRISPWATPTTT